jgi:endonuclease-3
MTGRELLAEVDRRLTEFYGEPHVRPCHDPLDVLIGTILSQNTSDLNRDRAHAALKEEFPRWEDVLTAPLERIEATIKGAGLYRQRAKRIKEVLARIQAERGELSLDFLADLPPEEAERWLLSLPGVGKKTAYIVLLFCFGRHRFPVDTHIRRVTTRLGLIEPGQEPHAALAELVPAGREIPLHLNLIRLGREICRPRRPRCGGCPLSDLCSWVLGKLDPKLRPLLNSPSQERLHILCKLEDGVEEREIEAKELVRLAADPRVIWVEPVRRLEIKEGGDDT